MNVEMLNQISSENVDHVLISGMWHQCEEGTFAANESFATFQIAGSSILVGTSAIDALSSGIPLIRSF